MIRINIIVDMRIKNIDNMMMLSVLKSYIWNNFANINGISIGI